VKTVNSNSATNYSKESAIMLRVEF